MKRFLLTVSLICAGAASMLIAACSKGNNVSYKFESNGGTEIADVVKNSGEEYTLPVPVKDGYEFEGWYLDENFSGTPVEVATATEDSTFYAKWAKLYAINLELEGGSLSATTLYLKAGANVYDFMVNYVPTKSGLEFGAWFNGNTELEKNTRMTESGITLTAKYKVGYSVEIYKQNLEGSAYVKDEEVVTGLDYIGVEVAPEISFTGFTEVSNSQTVSSKTLTANSSENVLKLFYDREEYSVRFNANYPDGTNGKTQVVTAKYGAEIELPVDLRFDGYCIIGWSETQSGSAEYCVDYVSTVLYNKGDREDKPADKYTVERNSALYAVWNKGYTDMFGCNDYIFLLDENDGEVYLARENVFFRGEYNAKTRSFVFFNESGEILSEGRLNSDDTFVYSDDSREKTYYLYLGSSVGTDKNIYVALDVFNGITYVDGNSTSRGTYVIEDGLLVAAFTTGELQGQEKTILVGKNSSGNVFLVRNEEELALGSLPRIAVNTEGKLGAYYPVLSLNGFGVATLKTTSSESNYSYTLTENDGVREIAFTSSYGISAGKARLIEVEGTLGYMLYNEELDLSMTVAGASLELDGMCNATYVKDGKTLNGYYAFVENSVFGGKIINFFASDNKKYTILITSETNKETDTEGNEIEKTEYKFEEKPEGYAEYYYNDSQYIYYTYLVLNDTEPGIASIYQRRDGKYYKVATGSYELNADNTSGTFTKQSYVETEGVTLPFDLSKITSFVFNIGTRTIQSQTQSQSYDVVYWTSSTDEEGTTDHTTVYTGANNTKLTLVAGFAFYYENGVTSSGAYSTGSDGVTVISATTNIYVIIDEENKTFVKLVSAPSTVYQLESNGTTNRNCYIHFDGTETGAIYTVISGGTTTEYVGTVVKTDKTTEFGNYVYLFTAAECDLQFEFIRMANSSAMYFAKYSEEYNGEYESEDGILTLDGFFFKASYISADGTVYSGMYYLYAEDVICLITDNGARYFDIGSEKNFTARGVEYGTYMWMDNRYFNGVFIEFDGYGVAKLFTAVRDENNDLQRNYIDEAAVYSQTDGIYTVEYTEGTENKAIVGKLSTFTVSSSNYPTFVVIHNEIVQTYVNEKNHSVLILDNEGNAIKIDDHGVKEQGTYTLITNHMLYYVNADATDACIYNYDRQKATATPVVFKERGYYTTDLESLLFSKYGFAIFNGETRYYYNVDSDGNVIIYRLGKEDEQTNEYGFVEISDFGKFENSIVYDGKTYYANSGYALKFTRGEQGEDVKKYPLPVKIDDTENFYALEALTFTPSGGSQFNVSGKVTINGKEYNCNVIRQIKGENVETYITIQLTLGYIRFDIAVDYKGEDSDGVSLSTYTVTALSKVIAFPSYNFLYMKYYYSMLDSFYGTSYASSLVNTLGEISLITEYDDAGNKTVTYANCEFGEASGMYDAEGNIVSIDRADYVYENNIYTINFVGEDGYDYCIRFTPAALSSVYGYRLYAFTRVQTLTDGEYTVQIERLIQSEVMGAVKGNPYRITLKKGEEDITLTTGIIMSDGTVLYISRTTDENGKITSTTYYELSLKDKTSEIVGEENENVVPIYESVKVTEKAINTYYTSDENGKSYVDIYGTEEVTLICINGTTYIATDCVYDSQTSTYTVTTYRGTYKVQVNEGVASISEAEEE